MDKDRWRKERGESTLVPEIDIVEIYEEATKDMSMEEKLELLRKLKKKYCKFLPKYPELREIITKIRTEQKDKQMITEYNPNQIESDGYATPEQAKAFIANIKRNLGKIG